MKINKYQLIWLFLSLIAIFFLYLETRLYFYLSNFTTQVKTCAPYDLLFQILPAINVYGIIKLGLPLTFFLSLIGLVKRFLKFPYFCFMSELWWLVRCLFMISTIFAIPLDRPYGPSGFLIIDWLNKIIPDKIILPDQTFMFSGHVGLPFFYFFLFLSKNKKFLNKVWFKENWLSLIFLLWSLIQAIAVILSRAHYTIDVISAYFISYSAYILGKKIFKPIEKLEEKLNKSG
jgi:hypothetical protein